MRRRGTPNPLLLLCLSVLASCDGQFRFDDPLTGNDANVGPPDAAPPLPDAAPDLGLEPDLPGDRPPTQDADCYVGLCGWRQEACTATGCELDCEERATCTGSCGTNCNARCESGSRCSLTGGDRSDLECRGADCSFVAGPASEIRCRDGGRCALRCLGPCTLDCEDAVCQVQCPTDTALRTVSGTFSCS
jgi:hypothetical protein